MNLCLPTPVRGALLASAAAPVLASFQHCAFAVSLLLVAPAAWASTANCVGAAQGGCALYVDASAIGSAVSIGPEVRYGVAFPANLAGGSVVAGTSTQFVINGVATFGMLSSSLSATASTTGVSNAPNVFAGANLNLYFSDRLTFVDATQPPGTLGTAYARIAVTGSVSASLADGPYTTSQAMAQLTPNGGASLSVWAAGDRPNWGGIPSIVTFALPVSFNAVDFTALNLNLQTAVRAGALNIFGASYAASAITSFSSGVEWLGIDRVVDANGVAVNGWSTRSASGFDYARSYAVQAIPEPASAVLLSLGCAVLLLLSARQPRA